MTGIFTRELRVQYGTLLEDEFLQKLSDLMQTPLKKAESEYSPLDFYGDSCWVELKVRTKDFRPHDDCMSDGWIVSAAKFLAAAEKVDEGHAVFFFYYWAADESLWVYRFNPKVMNKFTLKVPKNHHDKQLHYYVPLKRWRCCGKVKIESTSLDKPRQCLITDD